jgi:hypothetical protein
MWSRVGVVLGLSLVCWGPRAGGQCPGDLNGDNVVVISELITAVNSALNGCPPLATATATTPGSPTPPATATVTPTQSPAPTPVVHQRVFVVEPGTALAAPDEPGTGFFTTVTGGDNVAMSISGGPLTLVLGAPGAGGIAPLRLKEDVTLAVAFIDDTCLCLHLLAADSDGSVDCDGGTPYDTQATRSADVQGLGWTIGTGFGNPAGPGNGNLLVTTLFDRLVVTCEQADCEHRAYPNPSNRFAFTTATAHSVQETSGEPLTLEVAGEPFDCADFSTPGSGGMLAAPVPTTMAPLGDVSNVLRLAEAR